MHARFYGMPAQVPLAVDFGSSAEVVASVRPTCPQCGFIFRFKKYVLLSHRRSRFHTDSYAHLRSRAYCAVDHCPHCSPPLCRSMPLCRYLFYHLQRGCISGPSHNAECSRILRSRRGSNFRSCRKNCRARHLLSRGPEVLTSGTASSLWRLRLDTPLTLCCAPASGIDCGESFFKTPHLPFFGADVLRRAKCVKTLSLPLYTAHATALLRLMF
jgi:hypothetical protein